MSGAELLQHQAHTGTQQGITYTLTCLFLKMCLFKKPGMLQSRGLQSRT